MNDAIAVLRPLGLGDFLTGVPSYRALARAFPRRRVMLAAPRALAPLARWCDAIHDVVDTLPHQPLDSSLHGAGLAVDLHGRGPRSHRVLLAARPAALFAFANDDVPESACGPQWNQDEHEVTRWCRMLRWFDVSALESELHLDVPADPRYAGSVVVHPGAASEARRWPIERWVATIAGLRKRGATVAITGSRDERERCLQIADATGVARDRVLAGEQDLASLASTIAAAATLLCGDTGAAHLATATGTPSVILFGPTSPATWGPPRRSIHRAIWHGRTGDPHATTIDAGLLAISVDDVLREFDALFAAA